MNEIFIRLVRERNSCKKKEKRATIKIFIWLLLKEQKTNDTNHIYNYCFTFYGCSKNVVLEAMKELTNDGLITLNKKLGDARRKLLFIN